MIILLTAGFVGVPLCVVSPLTSKLQLNVVVSSTKLEIYPPNIKVAYYCVGRDEHGNTVEQRGIEPNQ